MRRRGRSGRRAEVVENVTTRGDVLGKGGVVDERPGSMISCPVEQRMLRMLKRYLVQYRNKIHRQQEEEDREHQAEAPSKPANLNASMLKRCRLRLRRSNGLRKHLCVGQCRVRCRLGFDLLFRFVRLCPRVWLNGRWLRSTVLECLLLFCCLVCSLLREDVF